MWSKSFILCARIQYIICTIELCLYVSYLHVYIHVLHIVCQEFVMCFICKHLSDLYYRWSILASLFTDVRHCLDSAVVSSTHTCWCRLAFTAGTSGRIQALSPVMLGPPCDITGTNVSCQLMRDQVRDQVRCWDHTPLACQPRSPCL